MNWINPPADVKRFTLQQMIQHAAAMLLAAVLTGSALVPGAAGSVHPVAGIAASVLLLVHLFSLLVIGVRHDVDVRHIAFLPGGDPPEGTGKYSAAERRDYFLILAWTFAVVAGGLVLRWPGRFGVPDPKSFAWLRIVHAATGAGWLMHILGSHVPARLISAPAGMRWSVFSGKATLSCVEERAGWMRQLVASGVLVPVPVEEEEEAQRETAQVRDLLETGNRLTRESRFEEASAVFEEALRLYPEYSQARFNLAVARLKQGRNDLAAEQFRNFLESDPFNPMAGKARELLEGISRNGAGGEK
jgi:hypothetical protein